MDRGNNFCCLCEIELDVEETSCVELSIDNTEQPVELEIADEETLQSAFLCNIVLEIGDDDGVDFFMDAESEIDFEIGTAYLGGSDVPPYHGQTVVIPRIDTVQILLTTGKRMESDITVREIPITETTNVYGGKTVLIG